MACMATLAEGIKEIKGHMLEYDTVHTPGKTSTVTVSLLGRFGGYSWEVTRHMYVPLCATLAFFCVYGTLTSSSLSGGKVSTTEISGTVTLQLMVKLLPKGTSSLSEAGSTNSRPV